jgi:hypothetical protein
MCCVYTHTYTSNRCSSCEMKRTYPICGQTVHYVMVCTVIYTYSCVWSCMCSYIGVYVVEAGFGIICGVMSHYMRMFTLCIS